ncbi:SCO4225 family membrane protein [Actinomadura gamaensis]|uniref:SCO4225 family membrane protein n=1 Tax=Actinomadura gamaensis TaxID=1763541 RepID=A0ABV9U4X9_9ACTN
MVLLATESARYFIDGAMERRVDGGEEMNQRRSRIALAVSLSYLAIVLMVAGAVGYSVTHYDASMAGIWLLLVTMPLSIIVASTPIPHGAPVFFSLLFTGVLQAFIIWIILRGRKGSEGP